jgi:hypothetical protein
LKGEINALFYRYRIVDGVDYVSDWRSKDGKSGLAAFTVRWLTKGDAVVQALFIAWLFSLAA